MNHEKELIELLKVHKKMRVKEAARALQVSERTIRNYIRQSPYLLSDRSGIWLNNKNIKSDSSIPQNHQERVFWLICKRVIQNETVDLFDACEELCIGFSTIKNDIMRMNQEFSDCMVHFVVRQNLLEVEGEEAQIRKMISRLLSLQSATSLIDKQTLIKYYGKELVETVYTSLEKIYKEYPVAENDFSKMNVLFHIVILVQRASLDSSQKDFSSISENEISAKLIHKLQSRLNVYLDEEGVRQIDTLILGNIRMNQTNPDLDPQLLEFVEKSVSQLESIYHANLSLQKLNTIFENHIQNLLIRAKTGSYIKNPLKDSLKRNAPAIYDMAVHLSALFEIRFGYSIPDDEIAFLAIHISSWIEQSSSQSRKLKAVLICPSYMNLQQDLAGQIEKNFGTELFITQIHGDVPASLEEDIDVVLTTIPYTGNTESCLIPPVYSETTRAYIANTLSKIKKQKKTQHLKRHFSDWFESDLFMRSHNEKQETILENLTQKLDTQHYIDEGFKESVFQREKACSTAYGLFAIPHPLEPKAKMTKIAVAIDPEGIEWEDKKVHVIILLSVNEYDSRIFKEIYEPLIQMLMDENFVLKLSQSKNFEEFSQLLMSQL